MNIKQKKKEIRALHYPLGGLAIVSALGIVGLVMVFFSGIFAVRSLDMFYDCLAQGAISIIFGGFFLFIAIFCWVNYILDVVVNPHEEIVIAYKNNDGETYLLNKKGRKVEYNASKLKLGQHYKILKGKNYVYEIIGETEETWSTSEHKSYWLNFYSPMGIYEDMLLLPILYVIALPGLLAFALTEGLARIPGLVFCAVPVYFIIYDYIYKIKQNRTGINELDDTEMVNFHKSFSEIMYKIILTAVAVFIIGLFVFLFISLHDVTFRLFLLPFFLFGICTSGIMMSRVFENEGLEIIFTNLLTIIFFIYWFGFIGAWSIGIMKQGENPLILLFTIPFIIAGISMIYLYFKKNRHK